MYVVHIKCEKWEGFTSYNEFNETEDPKTAAEYGSIDCALEAYKKWRNHSPMDRGRILEVHIRPAKGVTW